MAVAVVVAVVNFFVEILVFIVLIMYWPGNVRRFGRLESGDDLGPG